jgi:hypothetical protein
MNRIATLLLLTLLILAATVLRAPAQGRELPSPAAAGSAQPNLTVSADGKIYLSWIERLGEGRVSLKFAVREGEGWSAPQVIAAGSNWFVNWADFPSMVVLPDGTLAAHWLVKSSPETFDYDVTISRSFDGGKSWEKPFTPHRDGVRAEHGFVSLFAAPDGNLAAIWLDGREMKAGKGHDHGHGNMTLRYVKIRRDGTLTDEAVIDPRVCECCQTAVAMTADGPVVVYRDRSTDLNEIRDISISRLRNGRWSAPRSVAVDQWELTGCPVNGPAIAARGRRVATAWYTGAAKTPRVNLAFSTDGGEKFGAPVRIDDGQPIGRVDVQLLDDGSALVCWLEKVPGGGALRLRRITPDGHKDEAITIAPSGTARSNGFPQMVRVGDQLVFAWTGDRVLTATLDLPRR